jgi:hypothetical protein
VFLRLESQKQGRSPLLTSVVGFAGEQQTDWRCEGQYSRGPPQGFKGGEGYAWRRRHHVGNRDDRMQVPGSSRSRHGGHNLWWRRQPVAGVHGGETQGASRDSVVLVGTVPCRILHEPHGDDECSVGLSDTRHALDRNGKGEEVGSK